MNNIDEISICLGSSCYSRGNNLTLETIKNYLSEHNLKSRVTFKGHLCEGKCKTGPVIEINGKVIYQVSEKTIIPILEEHLTTLKKP